MKLVRLGPETNAAGELLSVLVKESTDLDKLKKHGLNIAKEMGSPGAEWVIRKPVVGNNKIKDAKDWQLEISKDCFLSISELPGYADI